LEKITSCMTYGAHKLRSSRFWTTYTNFDNTAVCAI